MRVLIVDDYADTRECIRLVLELRGLEVIEARDRREAVKVAFQGGPHLILMDLEMPIMDGFAAVECLRQSAHLIDVPIIAMSAHHGGTWVERAMACGFTAYLSKPVQFETLADMLSRYLPNPGT